MIENTTRHDGVDDDGLMERIERRLDELTRGAAAAPMLMDAIRYSLLGGGKRVRARLTLAARAACGVYASAIAMASPY